MIVFAVETSCDETSICILNDKKQILSHIIYSQTEHSKHGGVIPELASRSHLQILQKISIISPRICMVYVELAFLLFFCCLGHTLIWIIDLDN